jgi:hypothetical protein
MTRDITVAPGLELNDEMYERAVAALREHAPDLAPALSWERFTTRESWILNPDVNHPDEPFYKAELVVLDGPPWTRTVKINVWRAPDLRRDGAPMPHNHPWPFKANVLMGGYQEDRYEVSGGPVEMTHRAGDTNEIPLDLFHEVTNVLDPGRTLTLMVCGRSMGIGSWGHLDPDTGQYTPNTPDPQFMALLRDRNPHQR